MNLSLEHRIRTEFLNPLFRSGRSCLNGLFIGLILGQGSPVVLWEFTYLLRTLPSREGIGGIYATGPDKACPQRSPAMGIR